VFAAELVDDNGVLTEKVRSLSIRVGLAAFGGTVFGMLLMYCVMRNPSYREGYTEIADPEPTPSEVSDCVSDVEDNHPNRR
jgi:hypothetical protein